ncbi:MAG TPA: fibronectin type III domain-containing protein [Candidatus Hydrogenedentes bacterium]|nr:fibronectin type III domain-containing protein [Candidatus Hydrogenedentota bacterium]HPG69643.1 fibronectin type III domain-containing protein [Candidatus Hydrogenedentota bacterium]
MNKGCVVGGVLCLAAFLAMTPLSAPMADELSVDEVATWLAGLEDVHVFDVFEGQNEALKATAPDGLVLHVAAGFPVDMSSSDLFGEPVSTPIGTVYEASVTSLDAAGVRLRVDLGALGPGDEVWVVDPQLFRAFGPFSVADYAPGGRWLPTIFGDTAVLVVRGASNAAPDIKLVAISHFYEDLTSPAFKAELSCNINIACASAAIQELGKGVGFLVMPIDELDHGVCSGCLLDSVKKGPYFYTANHCVPTGVQPWSVEVVWDYRAATCGGTDAPATGSLPRSSGQATLVTDSQLDCTLMMLDSLPANRTFLKGATRDPIVGEAVTCIHHPVGGAALSTCHMRVSNGSVLAVDRSGSELGLSYLHETKVLWDEGVTETGSSGSCLLMDDGSGGYCVAGALSGGTQHTCGADRSNNYDYYSSFRRFYTAIDGYLAGSPPDAPTGVTASDGDFQDQVRVSWGAVAGATGYSVYRSVADSISADMEMIAEDITATSYDDRGAAAEDKGCFRRGTATLYFYWVRARNNDGDSGFSTPDQGRAKASTDPVEEGASIVSIRDVGDVVILALAGLALWAAGHRGRALG